MTKVFQTYVSFPIENNGVAFQGGKISLIDPVLTDTDQKSAMLLRM